MTERINTAPTISLTCPDIVDYGNSINCTIAVDDPDIPYDSLTCSIGAGDTCGGTLTDCTNYDLASASVDCTVAVDVLDDGLPPLGASDSSAITVTQPTVTIDCSNPGPNPVDEGSLIQCGVTALAGSVQVDVANDTCGGSIVGPNYEYTAAEALGGSSCVAAVQNSSLTSVKASDTVNITEIKRVLFSVDYFKIPDIV